MMHKKTSWDWEIRPQTTWLGTSLKEILRYKDLLFRLVRKELLTYYQQTLLGPLWIVINPLLTVFVFDIIFDKVIGISTGGIPAFAFYLAGITLWTLFSDIFLATTTTFYQNAHVFSKVYFPRIIAPLSMMLVHGTRFLVQLALLLAVMCYYYVTGKIQFHAETVLLAFPVIVLTAGMALGGGLIFSVITAMYRDLINIINVVIRLLMFVCPIFYSLSIVPEKARWFVNINPLSSLFELFRFAFFGDAYFSTGQVMYSFIVMVLLIASGVLLFNKLGDKLIDVV